MRYAFAEFVLDTAARQLLRADGAVHLEPKALELLELLLLRRPEAVSRSEIHERLWPGTFVSESSLTGLMAQVRKALGDDRRQERFVRTVQRFGYAFKGEVAITASAPAGLAFRLVWEGAVLPLRPGDNLLGRGEGASLRIDAAEVSRRHARIVVGPEGATVEDLGSKNGTFVGDRRLEAPAALRDGDHLRLGRQLLVFRRTGTDTRTETPSPRPA